MIVVDLSSADAFELKARNVLLSKETTYLTIKASAIKDCAYEPNSVIAIDETDALGVTTYSGDVIAPQLTEFAMNLDLPRGELTLSFTSFSRQPSGAQVRHGTD
jgi:hypothetical protein